MKLAAIRLHSVTVSGRQERFIVTYHLEFCDNDDTAPLTVRFPVSIPFDKNMTHAEVVAATLAKLQSGLLSAGQLSDEDIKELYQAGLAPYDIAKNLTF